MIRYDTAKPNDEALLELYVSTFEKLDTMIVVDGSMAELSANDTDGYDSKPRPVRFEAAPSWLDVIYKQVPLRFPKLFEQFLLSYRWPEVDLVSYKLAANLPGEGLTNFLHEISKDKVLWETLIPAGYLPFGKGPDLDYDPVCFDTNSGKGSKTRVVKIDHEEILCRDKIKIVAELAHDFLDLVLQTLEQARLVTPPASG